MKLKAIGKIGINSNIHKLILFVSTNRFLSLLEIFISGRILSVTQ